MQYPSRIKTGIKKQTVAFYTGQYVGHPKDFDLFNRTQNEYYEYFSGILEQAGLEFTLMGAEYSDGGLLRFVAVAGDPYNPDFVWQKYEGNQPAGGQNRVYVAGRMIAATTFKAMDRFMAIMMCMKTKEETV